MSAAAPAERFPGLPPAQNYEELAAAVVKDITKPAANRTTTPQREVQERYPGLPHRRTYEEHARTAMPPTRFRTPAAQAAKRPATTRKPSSLRKIALKAAGSHTPVQTPLKAASMTPGQVPCTPHPGAPLKGVHAYVEVFLSDGSCATTTYISVLQALGAKTTKTLNTDRVTHVVYKEGSPTTLQRLRHHNRQVEEAGVGSMIHCVNGRWVNDCKEFGKHVDELNEAYIVELDDFHAAKRRRKSMEPMSLVNIGGNVVRDRKSSSSLGRSAMLKLISSPAETGASTPPMEGTPANKENSGDDSFTEIESPETPAYLAAPESLVQQTAPANRIRKLDLQAGEVKNRRLTFWDGGA
ncbi:unnamed protein product [Zymoseptoria tritici ST99CH_3D7]|uniref:BRCT domain-containing protein n=2 Tax=Zymoseptoria tritici TaxID=1047171 RepID=A0A1X7RF41_ZYMT9|nr:unnamed protein product [Zymoseptoria tritici ST99CH_3D7]